MECTTFCKQKFILSTDKQHCPEKNKKKRNANAQKLAAGSEAKMPCKNLLRLSIIWNNIFEQNKSK